MPHAIAKLICYGLVIISPVDAEGTAIYAVELVLWLGIMLLGLIYNLRDWIQNRKSSQASATRARESSTRSHSGVQAFQVHDEALSLESISSRSSSVFQTVGLRKRAAQLLRSRKTTTTCAVP
jgi:hypothetical protein